MSEANSDDKIVGIRERFGMWGIGVYWSLVERVAQQMKGKNPIPVAVFKVSELCSFCGCKRNKLDSFLDHLQNVRGIKHEYNGNILKIEVPKLLEIKDNYSKDLEETSSALSSKEVEVEADKKKKESGSAPSKSDKARPQNLEAVTTYFREIGCLPAERQAQKWWARQETVGWKSGRNPMVDWKASCRTWKLNAEDFGQTPTRRSEEERFWICPDCKKKMLENLKESHWTACPEYKAPTAETMAKVHQEINDLAMQFRSPTRDK